MTNMKVIVTGSRETDYPWTLWAIERVCEVWRQETKEADDFIIVHGDCPTGIDHAMDTFFRLYGFEVEPHPADWKTHGKAAGPIRNQEMVDAGADMCIAFPMGKSTGTRDCIKRAQKAGIRTIVYEHGEHL